MKRLKKYLAIFIITTTWQSYAQKSDTIRLSDFQLCELTLEHLKEKDPKLKQIKVEEMNLCSDDISEDGRFENRIGYESKLYPGMVFQKYNSETNVIAKIHLTKEFKGYLPDGNYIDLKWLKAKDILNNYEELNRWVSRGCSEYWVLKDSDQIYYYYVKIEEDKEPRYPIDEIYYLEKSIEGIDLVANCYLNHKKTKSIREPLIVLDGKIVSEETVKNLDPNTIESITVLKNENAIEKYGENGKNGVIEVYMKK